MEPQIANLPSTSSTPTRTPRLPVPQRSRAAGVVLKNTDTHRLDPRLAARHHAARESPALRLGRDRADCATCAFVASLVTERE
jgi:hypothetical protein